MFGWQDKQANSLSCKDIHPNMASEQDTVTAKTYWRNILTGTADCTNGAKELPRGVRVSWVWLCHQLVWMVWHKLKKSEWRWKWSSVKSGWCMYVCMYVCMCLSVCMFLVQNSSTSVETCSNTPGYSVPTVPDSNNVRAVILNNKGGEVKVFIKIRHVIKTLCASNSKTKISYNCWIRNLIACKA